MSPDRLPVAGDATGEVSALVETLHQTDQRLADLTNGEVDTVADRDGRTILLRRAQDHWRHNEAAKQAAILDALPAQVALLDTEGRIVSVNEAWRRFARVNALPGPEYGIGVNYLEVCDRAHGDDAAEARQAAEAIRAVLGGGVQRAPIEYPCDSPTEQRCFLMTVTPLADDSRTGAVVMHLDITERKHREEALRRFAGAIDALPDALYLIDRATMRFVHVNDAACRAQGMSREALLARPPWESTASSSRAELERAYDAVIAGGKAARPVEMLRRVAGGAQAWVELRRYPQRFGDRWMIVSLVRDITERKRAAQALRASERRFSDLLGNVELISLMLDRDARITYCNAYLLRLTGWRREEVTGRKWFELFVPPEVDYMKDAFPALLANRPEARHRETEILTRSGGRRLIRWNNSLLRSGTGEVIGTASIGEDITDREEAASRIAHLNRVYAMLSGINALIVRVPDRAELFREACRIAVEAGGFRQALIAIVDRGAMTVVPVASAGMDEAVLAAITALLSSPESAPNTMIARVITARKAVVSNVLQGDAQALVGRLHVDFGVRSVAVLPLIVADEAVGVLALYASQVEFFHDEELKLLTNLAGDIAFAIDHIDKQDRLDYLAYYDALTGLANRRLFLDRVAQYVRSAASGGHKLAVLLIDLERFRNINDSIGRPAGDALLRYVADWLTGDAGDANVLARFGADHFALVLPDVNHNSDVARRVETLMADLLEHPFRLGETRLRIAVKVGAALFPDDGADADTLLRNAEAALKKAKAGGDRFLFYTQKMTESVVERLRLENQLREAFDKDEFVLHYQPKVSLATGKVVGGEALIRWNDPRTGLVPPARFIPILEEIGLIHDVGRWALRRAIADYLRWRAAGLPAVPIAVNVSPLQLRHRAFIAEIAQAIGIDAQAPAGLELEITESVLMGDVERSIASLQAIRAMGVTIAIDDFGTGFSSLGYLAKLPVDTLKIDRSFVAGMTATPAGLALVSTIISLAHSLDLNVVAEGVETEEQLRLLRLLRCDEMQGYLFSRPLPCDAFESRYLSPLPAG